VHAKLLTEKVQYLVNNHQVIHIYVIGMSETFTVFFLICQNVHVQDFGLNLTEYSMFRDKMGYPITAHGIM
jgi:hypothetical protein